MGNLPFGLSRTSSHPGRWTRHNGAWVLAFLVWAGAVATGFGFLMRYASTPSQELGGHPGRWPTDTRLVRDRGQPTLLVFAHPNCPCTRASMAELARLMARFHHRVGARVVIAQPHGLALESTDHALAARAAAIPGVAVAADPGGAEARRFGAVASGLALLYDRHGALAFAGGLTASRGHEGTSFGQRRIASLLTTGRADRRNAPVFGCALAAPEPEAPSGADSRSERRQHEHGLG
jgi:hypothetical protein